MWQSVSMVTTVHLRKPESRCVAVGRTHHEINRGITGHMRQENPHVAKLSHSVRAARAKASGSHVLEIGSITQRPQGADIYRRSICHLEFCCHRASMSAARVHQARRQNIAYICSGISDQRKQTKISGEAAAHHTCRHHRRRSQCPMHRIAGRTRCRYLL